MEIGGYFGLDLPDHGDAFPDAVKFQSGRAALRAALESAGIRRVLLPAYICDAVIRAVTDAGAAVEAYRLDDALHPADLPEVLPRQCAVLYVNYFGLCGASVSRLLQAYPGQQVIIDNSHALLAPPAHGAMTVYSPRKFVGVPDGGLLVTAGRKMASPRLEDTGSLGRMRHLLVRMASTAQAGYADYLEAENSLDDTHPLAMSRLSRRLLASVDMTAVARARRENFQVLADRLDACNRHRWTLAPEAVPLCYPLVLDRDAEPLKKILARKGIYIPTYWREVNSKVADGIEHRLTNRCLAVPCDQRYSADPLRKLAGEIMLALDR